MRIPSLLIILIAVVATVIGPAGASNKEDPGQAVSIARRAFEEVYAKGNLSAVDDVYSDDFVDDSPGGGKGTGVIKEAVASFHTGFSKIRVDIEDIFTSGDKVVIRYTAHATHTGTYLGVPPTGKELSVRGITIFQVSGGKIHREWTEYDRLGIMRQLGLIPAS